VSPHFGQAAEALTEKLINKGFDGDEASATVQQEAPATPDLDINWNTPFNALILNTKLAKNDLPASIELAELDGKNTLFFTPQTTQDDIKTVCKIITQDEAVSLQWKFNNYQRTETENSPANSGEVFKVPRLMVELDGQLMFADPNVIFEYFEWDIGKYAPTKLEKTDFDIKETPGKGFHIDIDGNRLTYSIVGKDQLLPYMEDIDVWQPVNLIYWLDRNLKQSDIPQYQMTEWLRKVIEHLAETRKIAIPNLMIAKFALLNKLLALIDQARKKARSASFNLFQNKYRKVLDFDNGFEFKKGMYETPFPYYGMYKFTKHFLGNNNIPPIDGGEKGEEFQCAKAIDSEPHIKYWIRNIARHPASFKLPTSTDYFYPDFVAKLQDGRILIIEYKGEHIADSQDTKEKENIGLIWEKQSEGRGLFLLAVKDKNGKNVEKQLKEKINHFTLLLSLLTSPF
jgi:type III restriction enzyme